MVHSPRQVTPQDPHAGLTGDNPWAQAQHEDAIAQTISRLRDPDLRAAMDSSLGDFHGSVAQRRLRRTSLLVDYLSRVASGARMPPPSSDVTGDEWFEEARGLLCQLIQLDAPLRERFGRMSEIPSMALMQAFRTRGPRLTLPRPYNGWPTDGVGSQASIDQAIDAVSDDALRAALEAAPGESFLDRQEARVRAIFQFIGPMDPFAAQVYDPSIDVGQPSLEQYTQAYGILPLMARPLYAAGRISPQEFNDLLVMRSDWQGLVDRPGGSNPAG